MDSWAHVSFFRASALNKICGCDESIREGQADRSKMPMTRRDVALSRHFLRRNNGTPALKDHYYALYYCCSRECQKSHYKERKTCCYSIDFSCFRTQRTKQSARNVPFVWRMHGYSDSFGRMQARLFFEVSAVGECGATLLSPMSCGDYRRFSFSFCKTECGTCQSP
jgi:hypothetical protein